jgi:hypothetical protein
MSANVPVTIDFSEPIVDSKLQVQCYEKILGNSSTVILSDFSNTNMSNKTDNINVSSNGLNVKDSWGYNLVKNVTTGFYESSYEINLTEFVNINSMSEVF